MTKKQLYVYKKNKQLYTLYTFTQTLFIRAYIEYTYFA